MKKLLILGAMEMHVPLIRRAKELGLYTITCDYIPENPGHKIADEAYFDSTTDPEAVLKLAERLKVDGIMTYNSDPAAPTAAYVAEKLGLPGNPYSAVKTMSEKDLFRSALLENGLNVPKFGRYNSVEEACRAAAEYHFPLIVKPVDSSGSKGCTVIHDVSEIGNAVSAALEKSRCKRFIFEEYIEPKGRQLHGDGFVKDGELVFLCLGDHHFDAELNNLVPYSTTYPTEHSDADVAACRDQIQRFLDAAGFKNGGINVELRISEQNGKAYIIDIGARNGGNFTPQVIRYATGFNFLDHAIEVAMGLDVQLEEVRHNGFFSYLILHSPEDGILSDLQISDKISSRMLEKHLYTKTGEKVSAFYGANSALGVLLMKYESRAVMNDIVENFNSLYTVTVSHT